MSPLPRLSNATLASPRYNRAQVRTGVVHLGLGAFHRAHQAPLFDDLIAGGDTRWGIAGVAMRSPHLIEALASQDGLYSLSERSMLAPPPRVVGAIRSLHLAARNPVGVVAAMADPDTHLVTLTVTEKGYLDHGPEGPAGLIARALERRRVAGLAPLTILSCDNRTGNGAFTREAVLTAASMTQASDACLRWIAEQVAFPASMVDRITPATTPAMAGESSTMLGLHDEAAVWTEPFWQWVVEDRFTAVRPALDSVGVQMVTDVEPWEKAKLRLLNAAHSALAYHGLLHGHAYVHETVVDTNLRRLIEALWDEVATTLQPTIVDLAAYRAALLKRFANPALPHALIQIAADGSQKLPPRILASLAERNERGLLSPALASIFAGWVQALARIDGLADPLLDRLCSTARSGEPIQAIVAQMLKIIGIDGPAPYADELVQACERMDRLDHRSGSTTTPMEQTTSRG
jgi:fructuronate reductase